MSYKIYKNGDYGHTIIQGGCDCCTTEYYEKVPDYADEEYVNRITETQLKAAVIYFREQLKLAEALWRDHARKEAQSTVGGKEAQPNRGETGPPPLSPYERTVKILDAEGEAT